MTLSLMHDSVNMSTLNAGNMSVTYI